MAPATLALADLQALNQRKASPDNAEEPYADARLWDGAALRTAIRQHRSVHGRACGRTQPPVDEEEEEERR